MHRTENKEIDIMMSSLLYFHSHENWLLIFKSVIERYILPFNFALVGR